MSTIGQSCIHVPDAVLAAVRNQDKVDEAPHSFYKYPARFSPVFAREVIKAFSSEGETVIDPFCGGGTSLVEAVSLRRKAAGFDISSLATFIAKTKMSPLSVHDRRDLLEWCDDLEGVGAYESEGIVLGVEEHYLRNLPGIPKRFFGVILNRAEGLYSERAKRFVRLVLLSVGQWALDCKSDSRSWAELRNQFCVQLRKILEQHSDYLTRVAKTNGMPRCRLSSLRRVINRSSEMSGADGRIPIDWLPAKLVVTSPPYPGVHVVYHRWQINGRKETPTPFWLANGRDGQGAAYYCLGRRDEIELRTYFSRIKDAFASVRELLAPDSIVAQLVAFSDPTWQLPLYLQKMQEAGFSELTPNCSSGNLIEGRIWRDVPGRKWYAKHKGTTAGSREVLLFHRMAFPVAPEHTTG